MRIFTLELNAKAMTTKITSNFYKGEWKVTFNHSYKSIWEKELGILNVRAEEGKFFLRVNGKCILSYKTDSEVMEYISKNF